MLFLCLFTCQKKSLRHIKKSLIPYNTALSMSGGYHTALVYCVLGKDEILPAFRLSFVNEGVTNNTTHRCPSDIVG